MENNPKENIKENMNGDDEQKPVMGQNTTQNEPPMSIDDTRMSDKPSQGDDSFFKSKKFLVIVIAVIIVGGILFIALLSTIAFVSLRGAQDAANDTKKINDIRRLELALLQYESQHGNYPIVSGIANGECNSVSVLSPYLSSVLPEFDFNDPDFFYCVNNPIYPSGYIIGVKEIGEGNSILLDDVDGNGGSPVLITGPNSREQCGITSSDTVYCISAGEPDRTGVEVDSVDNLPSIDGNLNQPEVIAF